MLHYSRFKDDGFIIIDGTREQRNSFWQKLNRIAGCFQIVFDSVSPHDAIFLDVRLHKGLRWSRTGVLDFSLHLKDSKQWTPLLPSSSHPFSVHLSWPIAQIRRIAKRFSDQKAGRIAVRSFKLQFAQCTGIYLDSVAATTCPDTPAVNHSSHPCRLLGS